MFQNNIKIRQRKLTISILRDIDQLTNYLNINAGFYRKCTAKHFGLSMILFNIHRALN